MLFSEICALLG